MIRLDDELRAMWKPLTDCIINTETGAKIMVMPYSENALQSWHLNVAILDEVHTYKDDELYNAVISGQRDIFNALCIVITTAAGARKGFLWEQLPKWREEKETHLAWWGAKDTDEEIASKENALKAAQEKLEEATKELEKYNAVAPIDGTVLQCSLTEGQEVSSGQGITIADTSQMIIEIQVDERNARYIKAGMMVDINQYGTPYVGIVESVSMTASGENGVASIPAVVTVDNYDGSMIPGTYAEYSFVASESEDCLTVPVQAVKYVSFANVQLPEPLDADPSAGMDDGMMDDGMMDDGMMDGGMMDGGMVDGGVVDVIREEVAKLSVEDEKEE